jgi:ribosome recycling factor
MTILWQFANTPPQPFVYSGNMEAMRQNWTDDRMDDLARRVDEGFHESREDLRSFRLEVKTDFASLRGEMDTRFDKVDARFEKIDARFERMDARFDSLQRLMILTLLTFLLGVFAERL